MRVTILLTIAVLLGMAAGAVIEQGTTEVTLFAGGALILVGLPLLVVARRQLGRAFAFTPQAKGLVTQGLYSRIPHPMYVFLDIALLGGIVVLRQLWLLVLWATLVAAQVLQAGREAKILERAFGDVYRNYRTRTWW